LTAEEVKNVLREGSMSEPYVGEIRSVGFNFAPVNWAFCNGALLPISQFEVLFTLLGTTYGGDGQTTFALPDLRGRTPFHQGSGGGASYVMGQEGGVETVPLLATQIPSHVHPIGVQNGRGDVSSPIGALFAASSEDQYAASGSSASGAILSAAGGSQPHSNLQPFLCVNYIISLFGIFPSQS
jgi:microcystin-dependent protein